VSLSVSKPSPYSIPRCDLHSNLKTVDGYLAEFRDHDHGVKRIRDFPSDHTPAELSGCFECRSIVPFTWHQPGFRWSRSQVPGDHSFRSVPMTFHFARAWALCESEPIPKRNRASVEAPIPQCLTRSSSASVCR